MLTDNFKLVHRNYIILYLADKTGSFECKMAGAKAGVFSIILIATIERWQEMR